MRYYFKFSTLSYGVISLFNAENPVQYPKSDWERENINETLSGGGNSWTKDLLEILFSLDLRLSKLSN